MVGPARFPAPELVVDACALVRAYKCGFIERLGRLGKLHVTGQVVAEMNKGGPGQKAALRKVRVIRRSITPGTAEWEAFATVRGGRFGVGDLGEDESIAVCLAEAGKGKRLPLMTFDHSANRRALGFGIVTIDFLTTLSWLVRCGGYTVEEADALELRASQVNGWRRPKTYAGTLESIVETACQHTTDALGKLGQR